MPQFDSISAMIDTCFKRDESRENNWYQRYKATHEKVVAAPDSDEALELLWYTRDNAVSSLMQGNTSKKEFENAKSRLRALTAQIIESPTSETYTVAIEELENLKSEGVFRYFYGALINRAFAAIAPNLLTSTVKEPAFMQAANFIDDYFHLGLNLSGNWFQNNVELKNALREKLPEHFDDFKINIAIWNVYELIEEEKKIGDNNINTELSKQEKQNINEGKSNYSTKKSLNRIFYGPPGTGKTYHTIEAAVTAAEPLFSFNSRLELKAKYDELIDQQRIQFVTFHQSYGYEEFIEGLRAVTEEGQISYEIQSGIFKRICTLATTNMNRSRQTSSVSFDACWEVFLNQFDDDEGTQIKTKQSWFRITEITETTIRFSKAQGTSKHSLAIKTLKQVFNGTKTIKGGLNVYYQPLVEYLKSLSADIQSLNEPVKNFVLVIDEINRGNISKIFGELITLIEESKRAFGHNSESIEVTLPYSSDPFSVPINLHLIGTMNTADRSLAMMDTALRRRFDFVEMMPDYKILTGVDVKGIALDTLMKKMNERIEALYDREHTLGHAFLMPVKNALLNNGEESAFNLLKTTYINKIIPLLEEYFFDDWTKIRLVLGDNQKPENLQFIKIISHSYDELFGIDHGLESFVEQAQSFDLASQNDNVWNEPEAYIGIYSVITEN